MMKQPATKYMNQHATNHSKPCSRTLPRLSSVLPNANNKPLQTEAVMGQRPFLTPNQHEPKHIKCKFAGKFVSVTKFTPTHTQMLNRLLLLPCSSTPWLESKGRYDSPHLCIKRVGGR